ncbi:phosphate ABC transporter substrate-binding/OmpA family protein [Jannaschia pohangensis]|uniref:Phosphate ABC transporter substrate-binding protein, PhoT family n=1 Tax=Jannaschia pohangensis TaxID=390807 RepID=A0A1I3SEU7_9RHOB|nr:phosphate ABC transporter substrate-binding/OmpA family protein [Jannaschia pohangensis]SFJ56169.1 phosphate ABC transporter substrate-binding protein, PhoT family [Jannaschia pohangensis]
MPPTVKSRFPRRFPSIRAVAATLALITTPLAADQHALIQLQAKDGSISISGQLVGMEDDHYIVATSDLGTLRIQASNVTCTGVLCPQISSYGPEFGIYGSRTVGTTLIPTLLRGYAQSVGASYELVTTDDAAERFVRLTNADGSLRAEIDLQTRGSGSAFPALAEGVAAIGVADRRMNDGDVEKLAVAGIPDLRDTANETVLGVDGIVMITHPANPVRNLTSLEIAKIWSGEITNWLELGGGNVPITVNSFSESSGDRAVMMDALVRPNNRDETAPVVRWSDYQDMIDAVMADRGGIGFVGRWLARTNDVNLLDIRETCGLLSPPTDFRMKIEGYALSRRLYAYTTPGDMHPEARAFLDWTLTDEAQAYIKESHFIDRELERMRLEDMGMMLVHTAAVEPDFDGRQYSDMMQQLRGADRLSVSFRFQTASSVLDVESVRNVEELAERMEAGAFDGMEVLLVGFADSIGNRVQNTALAQQRADTVTRIIAQAVSRQNALRLRAVSYGELLPLSCNEDEVGRERNRRVEVWLRLPDSRSILR